MDDMPDVAMMESLHRVPQGSLFPEWVHNLALENQHGSWERMLANICVAVFTHATSRSAPILHRPWRAIYDSAFMLSDHFQDAIK